MQPLCTQPAPGGLPPASQVRRGVPVLRVRKGIQTAAFLGPVLALTVLSNPGISPPLALLCMTAALGITSLGEPRWARPRLAGLGEASGCPIAARTPLLVCAAAAHPRAPPTVCRIVVAAGHASSGNPHSISSSFCRGVWHDLQNPRQAGAACPSCP